MRKLREARACSTEGKGITEVVRRLGIPSIDRIESGIVPAKKYPRP